MPPQELTLLSAFGWQYEAFDLFKRMSFPKAPSPLADYGNNFV